MKMTKTEASERKALSRAFLRFIYVPIVLIIVSSMLISFDQFQNKLHSIVHDQEDQIVGAMINYRNHVSSLTSIVRTIEADYLALAVKGASDAEFEALFIDNMLRYPFINKVRILDVGGMEALRVNQGNDAPYVAAKETLEDNSDRSFYTDARELGKHQFLFSALDLKEDNGAIEVNPETGLAQPTLRISSPVEINERRIGYLVVNFLMRETLDSIRNYLNSDGCYILMFNEDGYLYNDTSDDNNFGFCYAEDSEQYRCKITNLCPDIDLTAASGSFVHDQKICTYIMYANLYDRSKDYFLASDSTRKVGFLLYYDHTSPYANDLQFSYFYHLVASWKIQLAVWVGIILLYALMLRLFFLFDRVRFTDLFSDHRYTKTTLRQALHRHEFVNYYQPVINIQDGSVLGIEALSRWKSNGQVLPPSMFIDDMLQYQLGQMLDENVFLIVREDRKRLKQLKGFENAFISVNCCQQTFNSLIKEQPTTLIRLTEEEKKYIVLELLENIVFNQRTQDRIRELYKHNIIFAIDDFGTGNSNIAFIRSFENLKVKIDRTFVPVDPKNRKERIIIEAFVKMFIDQGLKMIVEGVETLEQIRYLQELGIQGVQGFYFSHPMTIDQLIEFIQKKEYLDRL